MKSWWSEFALIDDPDRFESELAAALQTLALDVREKSGEDAALGFVVQMARSHLRNMTLAAAMGDPSAQMDLLALGLAKAEDFKPDSDDRTVADDHLAAFKAAGEVLH